jgi:hypothetical protein
LCGLLDRRPQTRSSDDNHIIRRQSVASLNVVAKDVRLHHWELEFKQFSFRLVTRVLRISAVHDFGQLPLYQHAIVPFGFRRKVGWLTQEVFF